MPANHCDLIVIGTGPGGGALAQRLASGGKLTFPQPLYQS